MPYLLACYCVCHVDAAPVSSNTVAAEKQFLDLGALEPKDLIKQLKRSSGCTVRMRADAEKSRSLSVREVGSGDSH